jgi:hypothetical protein
MMADHPTLFSAPMVRAIIREIKQPGSGKTQTRRVLKGAWQHALEGHDEVLTWFAPAHVPKEGIINEWAQSGIWARKNGPRGYNRHLGYVPFRPGDRLWVREAWRLPDTFDADSPAQFAAGIGEIGCTGPNGLVRFEADGCDAWRDTYGTLPVGRLRASMHLPRSLSRLTLYVTDVRVQRLQDISEEDALAEGAYVAKRSGRVSDDYATMAVAGHWFASGRSWYADLWNRINGPGAWEANPWICAISFIPKLGNIDAI